MKKENRSLTFALKIGTKVELVDGVRNVEESQRLKVDTMHVMRVRSMRLGSRLARGNVHVPTNLVDGDKPMRTTTHLSRRTVHMGALLLAWLLDTSIQSGQFESLIDEHQQRARVAAGRDASRLDELVQLLVLLLRHL